MKRKNYSRFALLSTAILLAGTVYSSTPVHAVEENPIPLQLAQGDTEYLQNGKSVKTSKEETTETIANPETKSDTSTTTYSTNEEITSDSNENQSGITVSSDTASQVATSEEYIISSGGGQKSSESSAGNKKALLAKAKNVASSYDGWSSSMTSSDGKNYTWYFSTVYEKNKITGSTKVLTKTESNALTSYNIATTTYSFSMLPISCNYMILTNTSEDFTDKWVGHYGWGSTAVGSYYSTIYTSTYKGSYGSIPTTSIALVPSYGRALTRSFDVDFSSDKYWKPNQQQYSVISQTWIVPDAEVYQNWINAGATSEQTVETAVVIPTYIVTEQEHSDPRYTLSAGDIGDFLSSTSDKLFQSLWSGVKVWFQYTYSDYLPSSIDYKNVKAYTSWFTTPDLWISGVDYITYESWVSMFNSCAGNMVYQSYSKLSDESARISFISDVYGFNTSYLLNSFENYKYYSNTGSWDAANQTFVLSNSAIGWLPPNYSESETTVTLIGRWLPIDTSTLLETNTIENIDTETLSYFEKETLQPTEVSTVISVIPNSSESIFPSDSSGTKEPIITSNEVPATETESITGTSPAALTDNESSSISVAPISTSDEAIVTTKENSADVLSPESKASTNVQKNVTRTKHKVCSTSVTGKKIDGNKDASPDTSDQNNIWLYMIILMVSCGAVMISIGIRKHNES